MAQLSRPHTPSLVPLLQMIGGDGLQHSRCILGAVLVWLCVGAHAQSQQAVPGSGVDLSACAACHGFAGEGNQALNAPGLVNLEAWYVERQLRGFRDGLRGTDPRDVEGMQMRPFALGLDDAAIVDMAAAIAAYPDASPGAYERGGDAERGRMLYGHQCGACHGPAGNGNQHVGGSRLAGLDGWYLDRQLAKFTDGIRGSAGGDIHGAQMVFVMQRIEATTEISDIVAYLVNIESEGVQ